MSFWRRLFCEHDFVCVAVTHQPPVKSADIAMLRDQGVMLWSDNVERMTKSCTSIVWRCRKCSKRDSLVVPGAPHIIIPDKESA